MEFPLDFATYCCLAHNLLWGLLASSSTEHEFLYPDPVWQPWWQQLPHQRLDLVRAGNVSHIQCEFPYPAKWPPGQARLTAAHYRSVYDGSMADLILCAGAAPQCGFTLALKSSAETMKCRKPSFYSNALDKWKCPMQAVMLLHW